MKKLTGRVKISPLPTMVEFPKIGPIIPQVTVQSMINLLQSILKEDGKPLVTNNQAMSLVNIKLSNSDPLLSLEYRYFVYEVVNMLNTLDYDIVYNFLNTDWEKVFGAVPNIRKKILFENPLLKSAKEKLDLDMEIFRNRVDVAKGAVDCKKCRSDETISVERQIRSGDEPMTIRVFCTQCKYTWTAQ